VLRESPLCLKGSVGGKGGKDIKQKRGGDQAASAGMGERGVAIRGGWEEGPKEGGKKREKRGGESQSARGGHLRQGQSYSYQKACRCEG